MILEPDAVAHMVAGCGDTDADERYALLAHAVERLKSRPDTKVYLDAGNAGWFPDERRLVAPLRSSGIDAADGFALNVSNFHTDEESKEYGHRLAAALGGGKHFVIDSSRNGNGPYTGVEAWCNPPGRALGTPPTTVTGDAASTPTCGSTPPASPTGPAGAAHGPDSGGPSTRSGSPRGRAASRRGATRSGCRAPVPRCRSRRSARPR